MFYSSVIRSVLEYSCQRFHRSSHGYLSDELERIQRRAMRIIYPDFTYKEALDAAGIDTLFDRRSSLCLKLFNDITSNTKLAVISRATSSLCA